ncbi:hypothetical protein ANDA3_2360 [plant metagenome]|uniref:Uncharacterized protein n=1 Tax=plant metagenome TaxID=1297885 RepID=A0A484QTY3_9ZZZZ
MPTQARAVPHRYGRPCRRGKGPARRPSRAHSRQPRPENGAVPHQEAAPARLPPFMLWAFFLCACPCLPTPSPP